MKAKLTITIDETLIPKAKAYAREQGCSLSQLIENTLRQLEATSRPSFSERWRSQFDPADRNDERYRALAKRYL